MKLRLVLFSLYEVTLTSLFRCIYKDLLEVSFLQTGTTKLADLLVAPTHQLLLCRYEGWKIDSCLLHDGMGTICQGAKTAATAGLPN